MNVLETGLAFLEGLALIASPCILPVLPIILSASADGGKKRPLGIIAGFVVAFSLFALFSRQLIETLHLDVDIIRSASLWLLFFFGLILLSGKLSEAFSRLTQKAAAAATRAQPQGTGNDGFFSGMGIGALIGLIWTPCAGPILAAVLVQVIRQETDLAAISIILSFAVGAGLPMLAIALLGRSLLAKAKFLTAHTEKVRRSFGIIVILAVAYIAFGTNLTLQFTEKDIMESGTEAAATELRSGLKTPYPAPPFEGLAGWINSSPLTLESLKGKVVLVDFWTYSCINCIRTLPYLTLWHRKYSNDGFVIVGVHSPEFAFEKERENVKAAVAAHGIKYPVAQDNDFKTWKSFSNKYWPAHYLIDRDGKVVYTHYGEGKYDVTENNIRYLLGLRGTAKTGDLSAPFSSGKGQTPETYLGYGRAARYAGTPVLQNDITADYQALKTLPLHHWSLQGSWRIERERSVAVDDNASLLLNFQSKKAFLVMGSTDKKPMTVTLTVNGKETRSLKVARQTLYEIVNQPEARETRIEIKTPQPGLEVYAFTFGG